MRLRLVLLGVIVGFNALCQDVLNSPVRGSSLKTDSSIILSDSVLIVKHGVSNGKQALLNTSRGIILTNGTKNGTKYLGRVPGKHHVNILISNKTGFYSLSTNYTDRNSPNLYKPRLYKLNLTTNEFNLISKLHESYFNRNWEGFFEWGNTDSFIYFSGGEGLIQIDSIGNQSIIDTLASQHGGYVVIGCSKNSVSYVSRKPGSTWDTKVTIYNEGLDSIINKGKYQGPVYYNGTAPQNHIRLGDSVFAGLATVNGSIYPDFAYFNLATGESKTIVKGLHFKSSLDTQKFLQDDRYIYGNLYKENSNAFYRINKKTLDLEKLYDEQIQLIGSVNNKVLVAFTFNDFGREIGYIDTTGKIQLFVESANGKNGGSLPIKFHTTKDIVNVKGRVVFPWKSPKYGSELWVSNGTKAGTYLLLDIAEGTSSSDPEDFFLLENHIVFTSNSTTSNPQLRSFSLKHFDNITEIDNPNNHHSFNLFPNPSTGKITIETGGTEPVEVNVFDMLGVHKLAAMGVKEQSAIDLSVLPTGSYILVITGVDFNQSVLFHKQ